MACIAGTIQGMSDAIINVLSFNTLTKQEISGINAGMIRLSSLLEFQREHPDQH